jgi:hypothetical protein
MLVIRHLVLVWDAARRIAPTILWQQTRSQSKTWQQLHRSVRFSVPFDPLIGQRNRMVPTPLVVRPTGPNPQGHGVTDVRVPIPTDEPVLTGRRGHHLTTLNEYLPDVLVRIVTRSLIGIVVQKEYVHMSNSSHMALMD